MAARSLRSVASGHKQPLSFITLSHPDVTIVYMKKVRKHHRPVVLTV